MKNNEGDQLLRDKINSLDALAGGIVFGKEEAWDKLQARMEQKPVKKIPLRYWMAAAAVLLLFASVMTVYYYPGKQETGIAGKNEAIAPMNNTAVPTAQAVPVDVARENVREEQPSELAGREVKHKAFVPKVEEQKKQPAITAVPPIQTPVSDNKTVENNVATNNVAPLTIAKAPMKVVHINEVENAVAANSTTPVAGPPVAINKMKVVHINEMEKEEMNIRELLREHPVTIGRFPFSRSLYNDNNTTTEEYHDPRNMLKAMFNTQN